MELTEAIRRRRRMTRNFAGRPLDPASSTACWPTPSGPRPPATPRDAIRGPRRARARPPVLGGDDRRRLAGPLRAGAPGCRGRPWWSWPSPIPTPTSSATARTGQGAGGRGGRGVGGPVLVRRRRLRRHGPPARGRGPGPRRRLPRQFPGRGRLAALGVPDRLPLARGRPARRAAGPTRRRLDRPGPGGPSTRASTGAAGSRSTEWRPCAGQGRAAGAPARGDRTTSSAATPGGRGGTDDSPSGAAVACPHPSSARPPRGARPVRTGLGLDPP